MGSKQPTGILAANFVESLYQIYAMTYKKPLKCIRFDGGSYFDCPPVYAVMTKYNIAREQSAPYMHHQLKMERWWATMQHDAAAMCGTLSLSTVTSFFSNVLARLSASAARAAKTTQSAPPSALSPRNAS